METTQFDKAAAFKALHEGEPFVIPNPWDAGSAKALAALGFKALATTSSGFAFTLGRPDGGATLDDVVEHVRALNQATDLPVSVDLENGYGPAPENAAAAISRAAEAGAVGGSIEDYDPARFVRLEPRDRVVEVGVAADEVLGARGHVNGNPSCGASSAAAATRSTACPELIDLTVRVVVLDRPANGAGLRGRGRCGRRALRSGP